MESPDLWPFRRRMARQQVAQACSTAPAPSRKAQLRGSGSVAAMLCASGADLHALRRATVLAAVALGSLPPPAGSTDAMLLAEGRPA